MAENVLVDSEYIEFQSFLAQIEKRLVIGFDSSKLPLDNLIEQNTMFHIQMLLRRAKSLFFGIDNAIKTENVIQLALCVRSHFEVTGAAGYLLHNINKFISNDLNEKELDDILAKMNLGFKPTTKKHPYESVNVITMIKAADKILNIKLEEEKNALMDSYSWLSEFCHPNALGLIYSVDTVKDRKVLFSTKPFNQKEYDIIGYSNISYPLFFDFYDSIFDIIKTRKNMPEIIHMYE